MNKVLLSLVIGCISQSALSNDFNNDFNDGLAWEEESMLGEELPMVLTASRLKQPKAEVPASITVITAKHIKLWGVRTLPELMKFVPGMFVGHGDDTNNTSVAYHTSNPNTMRRLQVLIDGRSVYKSAISTVIWDDVGLAIEDIDRIEVTRGPNAAVYGANSYLGVINILTKHPEDSQGSRVSWRKGNKGTQDVYFRHGLSFDTTSLRISGSVKADEGFDGEDSTGSDDLRDGRKHGFINAYVNHQLDDSSTLDMQMGYKSGKTEIRQIDFDQTPPDKITTNGYAYGRWKKEFSAEHQSHLQAYWQKEERKQSQDVRIPTLVFEKNMILLHENNPEWATVFIGIPQLYNQPGISGIVDNLQDGTVYSPSEVMAIAKAATKRDISISQQDLDLTKVVLDGIPDLNNNFDEYINGNANTDLSEQRIDIEWQDTMRWSDALRTVSGLSYRQDSAYSRTYFNGAVSNDTWRAFLNAEYHVGSWLTLNGGGMYEYETYNKSAFSPRLAANFLINPQQSIRLVASQAVRSPDLLEAQPEFIVKVSNLTNNYLGLNEADFYQQKVVDKDEKSLKPERITSYELGYFVAGDLVGVYTEFDLKVFNEEMRDMISDPITLQASHISNDNEADVKGAEFQLSSRLNSQHSLWMTYSYLDITSKYVGNRLSDEEIKRVEKLEKRLSSTQSTVISWMYNSGSWSASLSYFNQDRETINKPYERFQLNIMKPFVIAGLNAEVSYYVQHNRKPDSALSYGNQVYSSPNVYYGQLAIEF
ncbi:TonB-dependent receptor [Oleispira antarctica RB-8]|uniref:TonB-dependent receptor n=1 Tax=Oleispira antarctica RB-8 TaxID=698738 RepID=R4YPW7_OLEAN|nr:TonB-dependent receptor [Oleispira antarctica RB-8]